MHDRIENKADGKAAARWWRRSLGSFRYALSGLVHLAGTQPNVWVQLALGAGAVAMGLWLRLTRAEWGVLTLTITIVLSLEAINTAIESAVDLASPELHPKAKIAKDVAAAAVLIGALGAIAVGLILFGPRLWERCFAG